MDQVGSIVVRVSVSENGNERNQMMIRMVMNQTILIGMMSVNAIEM